MFNKFLISEPDSRVCIYLGSAQYLEKVTNKSSVKRINLDRKKLGDKMCELKCFDSYHFTSSNTIIEVENLNKLKKKENSKKRKTK